MAIKPHCLVLSFPGQGHKNPMTQFSKLLVHEGVKVTLSTTHFYSKNLKNVPPSISIESISDGFDNGGFEEAGSYKAYLGLFWQVGPQTLCDLLEKLAKLGYPIDCIIYDSMLPWALDVAQKFGIVGVSYFTQNMAVNSIYYHVKLGKIRVPLIESEISLPSMPKLQLCDMPSFCLTCEYEDPVVLHILLVGQFSNIHKADWVLCNTVYELDKQVANWTTKIWPKFRTIGPNIPSTFLDKRIKDDEEYGATLFKSEECMKWLDNKPKGSVVYVSFGSLVPLNEEQMREIAFCLREINNNNNNSINFLWVVRATEETKLPKDIEKNSEKGLIVTWCSQLKVLAHEAVGCFVTHCGWNSTLEALSLGVPIIAMPQWSDQATNAKYIVDVWNVGIRVPIDEKKIVRRQALKCCVKEMMESEKGKEIMKNAIECKALVTRAVSDDIDDGNGSSRKNIIEFVNGLFASKSCKP